MSIARVFAVVLLALVGVPLTAYAQGAPAAGAPAAAPAPGAPGAEVPKKSPCAQDVQVFCQGIPQGQGDVLRCLADKSDQLSNSCKTHLNDLKKTFVALAADCNPDVEKFCADVPKAGARVVQCLRKRQKELSPPCDALINKMFVAAGGTPAPAAAAPAAAAPPAAPPPAAPAPTPPPPAKK